MILTEPRAKPCLVGWSFKAHAQSVHENELQAYVQHAKRTLVTGGYIIIVTNAFTGMDWFLEFLKNCFQTMQYPATFVYAKEVDRNLSVFLCNNGKIATIARRVEFHPSSFVPPFFNHRLLSNCWKRITLYGGVPSTRNSLLNKRSKSPICFSEKNVFHHTDSIPPYCPQEGTVLDLFAETGTPAMAALQCGRCAIVVEKDELCFWLAAKRLCSLV